MQVREIWRYPIKSIGGERLDVATVTPLGITGDRGWGVRDPATGNVLTARRTPKLLMATASIVDDAPVVTTVDGEVIEGTLAEMSSALSDWLGQPVELVAAGSEGGTFENPLDAERETDWVTWTGPAHAFHDSIRTRVSLVSAATLADRDIRRFRANVVLDGCAPGSEDELVGRRLAVGEQARLTVTKHIDRCVMVTRAQPGLPADLGVLKRVVRERDNRLGIGSLVETAGAIALGDHVVAVPPAG